MLRRSKRLIPVVLFAAVGLATALSASGEKTPEAPFTPNIPRAWDDEALRTWALPLTGLGEPPTFLSAEYYYRMPERVIYQSYPVYALGKEPPGYMEWVAKQKPEVAFVASKLKTQADWIKAGEIVFDSIEQPAFPVRLTGTVADLHDPAYYRREVDPPVGSDGVVQGLRYAVDAKGEVTVALTVCSVCHTRVFADGRVVPGAQGNQPIGRRIAFNMRRLYEAGRPPPGSIFSDASVPWLTPDPAEPLRSLSFEEEIALYKDSRQAGVFPRIGASPLIPAKTPDLIGVRDRKYLDATGLVRNRGIGDIMRYAAQVDNAERYTRYGHYPIYPDPPSTPNRPRFSDAQLYALALYIYSLEPPTNPNKPSELSRRGEQVFRSEGCVGCHTPPFFTNNKLTLAEGFTLPEAEKANDDILPISVGTDSRLALQSRKGTGYYKVPSLKGGWYRGPFEHNGSVATLEDWFDSRRLRDDYESTGFKGLGVTHRAVKGHQFGLSLSADDKRALIAFLKTL